MPPANASPVRPLVLAVATLALAGSADSVTLFAQVNQPNTDPSKQPLGGGRALDAGLSTTYGRVNAQVTGVQALVRYNNAIVQGEATGGRSLRVPLGYPSDSAGGRTSSPIYNFNRDATDWRVSVLGAQQAPNPTGANSGASAFRSYLGAGIAASQNPSLSRTQLDLALRPRSARSVESRADGRSNQLIGYSFDTDGRASTVRASALRGLIVESIDTRAGSQNIDLATNRTDTAGRIGSDGRPVREPERDSFNKPVAPRPGTSAEPLVPTVSTPAPLPTPAREPRPDSSPRLDRSATGVSGATKRDASGNRVDPRTGRSVIDDIRQSYRDSGPLDATAPARPGQPPDPTKAAPITDAEIDATLERLRARLRGEVPPVEAPAPSGQRPSSVTTVNAVIPTAPAPSPASAARAPRLDELSDDGAVGRLERMSVRLKELVPEGATWSQAADGYLKLGQEAMAAGKYVSAEQAFEQALVRRPRDPFARAGRIHAQLASSMFLSAGLELRTLFADNPELIPVRYDAALIMKPERAAEVVEMIRDEWQANPGSPVGREGALQMAYLGYQLNEPKWLADGLAEMDRLYTEKPASELASVLSRVWGAKKP